LGWVVVIAEHGPDRRGGASGNCLNLQFETAEGTGHDLDFEG